MKYSLCIFFLGLLHCSCGSGNNRQLADEIKVSISKDSAQIVIKGIDDFILKELASDSLSSEEWRNNIAVYPKSGDEDLQDLEQPVQGDYVIQDSGILFKPLKPFKKGRRYMVELYLQHPEGEVIDQLKPSNSPFNQKPIRKVVNF